VVSARLQNLESQYGVTSADLNAWIDSRCARIPSHDVYLWLSLIAVLENDSKENDATTA
jgi:hypothetical protein